MDDGGDLAVPAQCVAWCRAQDYGVSVCDDMAPVDLDWWNTRLKRHAIPTRIVGRDADGLPTDHGIGYLRRADLAHDCDGGQDADTSAGPGSADLAVLYRAAAWLSDTPTATGAGASPTSAPPHRRASWDRVTAALAACRHTPWQAIPDAASGRRWSGWPHIPGVGPGVVSLYLWATHHVTPTVTGPLLRTSTAVGPMVGPQLLDQQAVTSLVHLGWVGEPVAARFTWGWYLRYCEVLCDWATQGDMAVELVETWLVRRWRERTATRRSRHTQWNR